MRIIFIALSVTGMVSLVITAAISPSMPAPRIAPPSKNRPIEFGPTLERIVLKITPAGTHEKDAIKAINERFRCEWQPRQQSVELLSALGYHTPLSHDDYSIESDFVDVGPCFGPGMTVDFLFDASGNLKDVAARIREPADRFSN